MMVHYLFHVSDPHAVMQNYVLLALKLVWIHPLPIKHKVKDIVCVST